MMFFASRILTTALTLLVGAAYVSAEGCFTSGQTGNCDDIAPSFCQSMVSSGPLIGNERRTRCYNTGRGYKCDMRVINTGGGSRTVNTNDCGNAMFTNGNCDRGGIKTVNGIEYTLDPNSGSC